MPSRRVRPSGTGYAPRPERLGCGEMMKWMIVVRRRKIKRYGRDKYPVRHIENLEETNTMPSRRVAADLNDGTYYLTLTIQRWYYGAGRGIERGRVWKSCAGRLIKPVLNVWDVLE